MGETIPYVGAWGTHIWVLMSERADSGSSGLGLIKTLKSYKDKKIRDFQYGLCGWPVGAGGKKIDWAGG